MSDPIVLRIQPHWRCVPALVLYRLRRGWSPWPAPERAVAAASWARRTVRRVTLRA